MFSIQCRFVKRLYSLNEIFFECFNNLFAFGDSLFALTQKVSKKVKGRYKNDKDLQYGFLPARLKVFAAIDSFSIQLYVNANTKSLNAC